MARGSRQRSTSRLGMEGRTNNKQESDYMLREMEVRNEFPPIMVFLFCFVLMSNLLVLGSWNGCWKNTQKA
jgi:hypothetical protein